MKKRKRKKKRYPVIFVLLLSVLLLLLAGLLVMANCLKSNNSNGIKKEQEEENIQELENAQTAVTMNEEQEGKDRDINDVDVVEIEEEQSDADSQEDKFENEIKEKIASMSLEEKILQMFMITPEALTGVSSVTQAGESTRSSLDNYPVGGLIYFRNNILSEGQCSIMMNNVQSYSKERIGLPLFIGVDEEGGSVKRITGRGFTNVPDIGNMYEIGITGDVQKAYDVGSQIGSYLKRFGFNVDFAPVADVYSNPNNSVIGKRSFGTDANSVGAMVQQEVTGLQETGIFATVKHFPGHGDTSEDSHNGMAISYKSMDEIRMCELIPFQAGIDAGAQFVMVGHISYPNITNSDIPASLSYTLVTDVLRGEMGFKGIIITDAMNMGAVANRYNSSEAAIMAVEAGIDMILMPYDFHSAYQGLVNAVKAGRISEDRINQSVERILVLKLSI